MKGVRLCGLGELHLSQLCDRAEAERRVLDQDADLPAAVGTMQVSERERQLSLFAGPNDAVFEGFRQRTLPMPMAAQRLFGDQSALGIHVVVLRDAAQAIVRHLAVRKKDEDALLVSQDCAEPHDSTNAFS